jgi:SAM-dependent methyltransferase
MTPQEVKKLYDDEYAQAYDATYRTHPLSIQTTANEAIILKTLLKEGGPWLDAGCGTGYFLARFPNIDRVGLDISPAMLALAREANPSAVLIEGNFLDDRQEWHNHFRVVSCMWYAYSLVESLRDVEKALNNFAAWTAPEGRLFIPVCDPRAFVGNFPARLPWWGTDEVRVTGVTWEYEQSNGKKHTNLISPTFEVLEKILHERFEEVRAVRYPEDALSILASKKK